MFYLEFMFVLFVVWVCGVGYGVFGVVFLVNVVWCDIRKIRLMEYEVIYMRREVCVCGRVNLKYCEGKFVIVKMNLGMNLFGFFCKVIIGFINGIGFLFFLKYVYWFFNLFWWKVKIWNVKCIWFFVGGYLILLVCLIKVIFCFL